MNEHHGGSPHSGLDSFFALLRRPGIVRVSEGKWFAGVATGLARWLGVDPLVVRAGFILFGIFFGMGIALYLVLWLLLPAEDGSLSIEKALRHGDGGSIFLLIVTILALFGGGNPGWRDDWAGLRFVGFIALGAAVWWILTRHDSGRGSMSAHGVHGWTPPQQAAAPPTEPAGEKASPAAASSVPASAWAPGPVVGGDAPPSQPGWQATAQTAQTAPQPPAPPRVTTPVLGFAAGAVILGVALLAGALTTSAADRLDWPGNHVSIGMAVALGVIGLGALVAGLAGRRTGWIAPFAILGIIATLLSSVSPVGLRQPWRVGDNAFTPATVQGAGPYELGAGQLNVDLSGAALDDDPSTVQTVRASVGAGEVRLVVPSDVAVRVDSSVRVGGLTAFGSNEAPDSTLEAGGIDYDRTVEYGSGPTQLVVEAEVGLGQIIIRKD